MGAKPVTMATRALGTGLVAVAITVLGPSLTSGEALASMPALGPETVGPPPAIANALSCLECHRNPEGALLLPSGERLSLRVDEQQMAASVHGDKLGCTDCHARITGFPHRKPQVKTRREYSIAQYDTCKRCHFANYSKTLDSIHYQALETGNQEAPLCTDCHGYHGVTAPDRPRSKISSSCAGCHTAAYDGYVRSVHGTALMEQENQDVPVCTDCHGTHTIRDSGSASFRLNSPEMCARCHADAALMRRYDLSSNVFKTYVQDFHGATVALTRRQGADTWTDKAVCSDCHGVHDIQSTRTGEPAAVKQKVRATCEKCHPDAGTNFPDAWLSHYDLSARTALLPYLVRTAYSIAIPLMIGGLMLHTVMDLWRIARNR